MNFLIFKDFSRIFVNFLLHRRVPVYGQATWCCICVRMCVCTCVHACVHACVCVCVHVCMDVCAHVMREIMLPLSG